MQTSPKFLRTRLSALMFLEYMLLGAWLVPIGGYMNSALGFTGSQIGWIYTTQAIGAIVSPWFVGYFADRFFATEKIMGVLHLAGAICLFLAAGQTTFPALMTLLVIYTLCYMPTLALVNSLIFRNISNADKFSRIAVWGTIGWIVSGLTVGLLLGDGSRLFFFLAAGAAVVLGIYSFTLPHTPPKRAETGDVLGFVAAKSLRTSSFLAFAVSVPLVTIAFCFYSTWTNAFLIETGSPKPTALMTLSQFSEIAVMVIMPWFIVKAGLKNVLVIGMAALTLRFLSLASMSFPLIIVALLLHGFCYCFINVAASIYGERVAPPGMSARAQSFIAFLVYGVGTFLGSQIAGITAGQYAPTTIAAIQVTSRGTEKLAHAALPEWVGVKGENTVRLASLETLPEEGLSLERRRYGRADLIEAFRAADTDRDGVVALSDWQKLRVHNWPIIWCWPAGLALLACVFFLFTGKEPSPRTEEC